MKTWRVLASASLSATKPAFPKAVRHDRRVMAGSQLREPPRDGLLSGTLLTLITPDSMKTLPAKAGKSILCVR
jgi:hypothetical protein